MDTIALLRSLSGFPSSAVEHGTTHGRLTPLRLRCELVVDAQREDAIALVDHDGCGDATTVSYLMSYLEALTSGGARRLVLDFEQTAYSNETHLDILVGQDSPRPGDPLRGEPGRMRMALCSLGPKVQVVFDMLGLSDHLAIAPDRGAALKLHGLQRPALPRLEPLLERACAEPGVALAALDALRERGHPLAGLLDDHQLRIESIRRGPVRVPDAPMARLIVPLGARHEAVLALAEP